MVGQFLEFGDEFCIAPRRQIGVDSVLDRCEPLFLKAPDRAERETFRVEISERWPTPHGQRLTEEVSCSLGLPSYERFAPALRERMEPLDIALAFRQMEDIAWLPRLDPLRPKRSPQPRDVRLQGVPCRLRRRFPETLDELVGGQHLVCVDEQDGQQGSLARATDGDGPVPVVDLQRAE